MKRTEKKRKQKKVVLICTLATAAVIVGGMTFAWFSSKDEVTNRFTANANFGASIVEDFVPEEEWLPGQTVNKDVAVVNTGTVDAFVRTWLEGELRYLAKSATQQSVNGVGDVPAFNSATKISVLLTAQKNNEADIFQKNNLVLAGNSATNKYYKVLDSQNATSNPTNSLSNLNDDPSNVEAVPFTEVQSLQAGGWLAYAPADAQWTYSTNDNMTVSAETGNAGTISTPVVSGTTTKYAPGTCGLAIDAATFKPVTTGLYLFRRNVDMGSTAGTEYSGYYYVANGTTAGAGDYYALTTKVITGSKDADTTAATATTVYADGIDAAVSGKIESLNDDSVTATDKTANRTAIETAVKLYTAEYQNVDNNNLTWAYAPVGGTAGAYTAKVTPVSGNSNFAIDIALVNVGAVTTGKGAADANETWTKIDGADPRNTTFYYKNDVESGDTTSLLVDSVKLSENVTANDYIAFDFDLNVKMDSVQVTKNEAGVETGDTVDPWAVTPFTSGDDTDNATQAYGAVSNTGEEITSIDWTKDDPTP